MAMNPEVQKIAHVMYRAGNPPEAQKMAESYLAKHPNDAIARGILGQALAAQLKPTEARIQLMKALKRQPKNSQILCALGEVSMNTGNYRDALAKFDKSLKYSPGFPAALSGKMETYLRLHKIPDAIRVFEQSGTVIDGNASPDVIRTLTRARLRNGETEAALDTIRLSLPLKDGIPSEHRRSILFLQGECLMKLKRHQEAFESYKQANEVYGRRWNPQSEIDFVEESMELLTSERIQRMPKSDVDASGIVLIVGLPRCGSTLTEQIIDAHPMACGVGESTKLPELANLMHERFGHDRKWPGNIDALTRDQLVQLGRDYMDHISTNTGNAKCIVDKQLGNFMSLGLIEAMLPGARVIHCTRHPMDLGLSVWTNLFAPGQIAWGDHLDDIGHTWNRYRKLMSHWDANCSMPRMDVHYERLVEETERYAREIIQFCGLEWDPVCLRFWESKRTVLTLSQNQVNKPIYSGSVARHAAWGGLLDPLRGALGPAIDDYEQESGHPEA
tara:strand:+ start:7604 stop:9109 length:1506 start_codon:yes stop_codon:yes gene_type:complete